MNSRIFEDTFGLNFQEDKARNMPKIIDRRVAFWMLFLALIGAILQTKSAVITREDIFIGLLAGAAVGFLIGTLIKLALKK